MEKIATIENYAIVIIIVMILAGIRRTKTWDEDLEVFQDAQDDAYSCLTVAALTAVMLLFFKGESLNWALIIAYAVYFIYAMVRIRVVGTLLCFLFGVIILIITLFPPF